MSQASDIIGQVGYRLPRSWAVRIPLIVAAVIAVAIPVVFLTLLLWAPHATALLSVVGATLSGVMFLSVATAQLAAVATQDRVSWIVGREPSDARLLRSSTIFFLTGSLDLLVGITGLLLIALLSR